MGADSKKFIGLCSVLMAALFAVSTCFQFNDTDWYFWITLYATACIVNLVNVVKTNASFRKMAKFAFWLGLFLFVKVSMEDFLHGIAGFWSLDMRERVVREKIGSVLVVCSMFLQLEHSSNTNRPGQVVKYGMPILASIAYGLSFGFFVFHRHEMRYL